MGNTPSYYGKHLKLLLVFQNSFLMMDLDLTNDHKKQIMGNILAAHSW